jgi:hypothetical protein
MYGWMVITSIPRRFRQISVAHIYIQSRSGTRLCTVWAWPARPPLLVQTWSSRSWRVEWRTRSWADFLRMIALGSSFRSLVLALVIYIVQKLDFCLFRNLSLQYRVCRLCMAGLVSAKWPFTYAVTSSFGSFSCLDGCLGTSFDSEPTESTSILRDVWQNNLGQELGVPYMAGQGLATL